MAKNKRRTYKVVRSEGEPLRAANGKLWERVRAEEHKARVRAEEKRVAAELAQQHRTPWQRCLCGVLVKFKESADGWWWSLAVWSGNSQRATIPLRGPYPTRPRAVKEAAKFVSGVVRKTKGTVDLMAALCRREQP